MVKDRRTEVAPKLRVLAFELAKGETVEAAMLSAGYAPKTARTGQIKHNGKLVAPLDHPGVAAIVDSMMAEARRSTQTTVHDLVAELSDAHAIAKTNESPTAMVAATMGKAKLLGLIVDKKQHSLKRLADMTDEELAFVTGEDDESRDSVG